MALYTVTVEVVTQQIWEVEAETYREARDIYSEGDLVDEEFLEQKVTWAEVIEDPEDN